MEHLEEIVQYAASAARTTRVEGRFLREHFACERDLDFHFACMTLVNWLHENHVLGYRGAEALPPKAGSTGTLVRIVAASDELSRLFVVTPQSLDYRPDATAEARRRAESLVPSDLNRDADV